MRITNLQKKIEQFEAIGTLEVQSEWVRKGPQYVKDVATAAVE